jgi:hypothetical protein
MLSILLKQVTNELGFNSGETYVLSDVDANLTDKISLSVLFKTYKLVKGKPENKY